MIRLFRTRRKATRAQLVCALEDGAQTSLFVTLEGGRYSARGPRDLKVTFVAGTAAVRGEAGTSLYELSLSLHELREIAARAEDRAEPFLKGLGRELREEV